MPLIGLAIISFLFKITETIFSLSKGIKLILLFKLTSSKSPAPKFFTSITSPIFLLSLIMSLQPIKS
jgi:hypothetical protein